MAPEIPAFAFPTPWGAAVDAIQYERTTLAQRVQTPNPATR